VSLKRGIFYTFLTQAPTLVLYFLASIFMTRVLGDEGRGAYALLQNQVVLITLLLGLNFGFSITYFTAKDRGDPSRMVRIGASVFLFNLVLTPLILALLFWDNGLHQTFLPDQADHWGYMLYLFVAVLCAQASAWIGAIMLARKKFRVINRMSLLSAALGTVGYCLLYWFGNSGDPGHALALVLGIAAATATLTLIVWCLIYVREVGIFPTPTWDWALLRPVLGFSMIGYLGGIINMINYRFDIWVVGNYAGTAQLGLYAVAVGVGQLLFHIPEPASRVVQPYLYGNMDTAMLGKFKFISRMNFTLVALLALLLGLSAHWVFPLLYGDTFAASASPLAWLLPGIIFVCASKLLGPLLVQGGLIQYNLYGALVSAVVTIGFCFLLIPRMGIVGASIASTISYFANFTVQCMAVRLKMRIGLADMFLLLPSDIGRLKELVFRRLANP
jgi:O-antigen/teichoic acid export membrane protein